MIVSLGLGEDPAGISTLGVAIIDGVAVGILAVFVTHPDIMEKTRINQNTDAK